MAHLALYREWRPQDFREIVSQKQVVYPLQQSVINGDIGHALLFSGSRGTGKTSIAKIVAKAVNCLAPEEGNPCNRCEICLDINRGRLLDVMEIDAASNNSVDNIRRITDEVIYMPSRAKFKVYIVDEVHMLSQGAFNALLKTLEEPPSHVIFILATTEPQRIPATILSRCQRFDFRRIGEKDIEERLRMIADKEGIDISAEAVHTIARLGDGALRDAISLLDQAQSGLEGRIEKDDVLELAGLVRDEFMFALAGALFRKDGAQLLKSVDQLFMSGRDLTRFLLDFAYYLRNILLAKISARPETMIEAGAEELSEMRSLSALISYENLLRAIERVSKICAEMKWAGDPRIAMEIGLIALMTDLPQALKGPAPSRQAEREPRFAAAESPAAAADPQAQTSDTTDEEREEREEHEEHEEHEEREDTALNGLAFHFPTANPEPIDASAPPEEARKIWDKALSILRSRHRIDLAMLLSPARVESEAQHFCVCYAASMQAHARNIRRSENLAEIRSAVCEAAQKQYTLDVQIEDDPARQAGEENLNPEEPAWVANLRQHAEAFGLPLTIESSDEAADDRLPF